MFAWTWIPWECRRVLGRGLERTLVHQPPCPARIPRRRGEGNADMGAWRRRTVLQPRQVVRDELGQQTRAGPNMVNAFSIYACGVSAAGQASLGATDIQRVFLLLQRY